MSHDDLITRALRVLSPCASRAELARRLDLPPDGLELDELLEDARLVELDDGRIASAPALLDGLVLWHRLDADEVATRQVGFGIEGELVVAVAPGPPVVHVEGVAVPIVTWSAGGTSDPSRGLTVPLPDGWTTSLAAGDLVGLAFDEHRASLVHGDDAVGRQRPTPDVVAALGRAMAELAVRRGSRLRHLVDRRRRLEDQWVVELTSAGPGLLADHGEVLRRLHRAPLGEALTEAGLTVHGSLVAGPGVDDRQLETFAVGQVVAAGETSSTPTIEACGIVLGAITGPLTEGFDEAATAEVVRALMSDRTAAGLLVDHMGLVNRNVVSEAERRLRPVRRVHPGAVGPAWLQAALLLRQARPHDAREVLESLVRSAAEEVQRWPRLVVTAGRLRALAGDVDGAAALLTGGGGSRRPAARHGRSRPRRNDPCPCRSGRKAKTCCLRNDDPAAGVDMHRLWDDLTDWALEERPASNVAIAHLARRCASSREPLGAYVDAIDVFLLEGGGLAEAVDEVGALLPTAAYDLAARWRLAGHSLWTVVTADAVGASWRDECTGYEATVLGRLGQGPALDPPTPGSAVIAALLPGFEGHHLAGRPAPVAPADVDRVASFLVGGLEPHLLAPLVHLVRRAFPEPVFGVEDGAERRDLTSLR